MMIRRIIISEAISYPFDEGTKNVISYLISDKRIVQGALIVTNIKNRTNGLKVKKLRLNKIFMNNNLRDFFRINSFIKHVIYIPEASATLNSLIRGRILKLLSRNAKLIILATQRREFGIISRILMRFLKPDYLLLLCQQEKDFFERKGFRVVTLPPVINAERFHRVDDAKKQMLRIKYDLPLGDKIVSHIGHIKRERNLECLLDVQKLPGFQVVVVGSTTTCVEKELLNLFRSQGIIVINKFLPEVQEIYQLSDIYVFPVKEETAAIDMPLSILEALGCNIPIVTTRFGGIIEYFSEDDSFKYFDTTQELISLLKVVNNNNVSNDIKVREFTPYNFVSQILSICN